VVVAKRVIIENAITEAAAALREWVSILFSVLF
jgi:hypothetical protein